MSVSSNVAMIRQWLNLENIDALIIPSSDPHDSEYTPEHWKVREWATGFTGSAGTAVITKNEAAMWTDSRYFIQAEQQLANTPYALMKEGVPGVPSMVEWLNSILDTNARVAFVGQMVSIKVFEEWIQQANFEFTSVEDPFDYFWHERPQGVCAPLRIHLVDRAGETVKSKLERIRQAYAKEFPNYLLLSDLSEIAWALNLRGNDVPYNPFFLSYLLIYDEGAILFVDKRKMTPEVSEYLNENNIKFRDYARIKDFIAGHHEDGQYYVFASSVNYDIVHYAEQLGVDYDIFESPVSDLRKIKNDTETCGFRKAMQSDGCVLVKMLRWLNDEMKRSSVTEVDVANKILALRKELPDFRGEAFVTITGYGSNGAIVHYEAEEGKCATLRPKSFLLLDTGAHYQSGTTDVSRTIPLGPLTDEERHIYTLVLKGHIALARCIFPTGTVGVELDLAARYAMWQEGYDFGHGTGHGVGARLCVHEGPQQIRKNVRPCTLVPFEEGMTITDEPGLYIEGKFGVRIENVLMVQSHSKTPYGTFLHFENLTLCPISTLPIVKEMLTPEEVAWVNAYNAHVCKELTPLLDDETDKQWLSKETQAI